MKLIWERRYGWGAPDRRAYQYWALTRKAGSTIGINTGYWVGISGFEHARPFAAFPDGGFRFFDSEDEAKDFCEVCCKMGVHDNG